MPEQYIYNIKKATDIQMSACYIIAMVTYNPWCNYRMDESKTCSQVCMNNQWTTSP